ncbi:MAG: hypothetical protein KKC76_13580 [Proteobacteria bacterium]|nr:hypothetical protein [Pseudomonadota bacterium]MBU4296615.1 hypothetical protein [Pseudomonadota bacterium]MCG2748244.1 hypothetical protein [Desulfobulbaceae bacterium]
MIPFKNFFWQTLTGAVLVFSFCIGVAGQAEAQTGQQADRIERIAVMPFLLGGSDAIKEHKLEKSLDCQLRGLCTLMDDLQSDAGQILTDIFQQELKKTYGDNVVPAAQVQAAYNSLTEKQNRTPRELAMELGKELRADHVMVGLVWRYKQREGSSMSVQSPASVAFSAYVVKVADGALTWKANFDKTQSSLSENLFDAPMFLKQGMKWLTAEELASYGAGKMLKGLADK